MEASTKMTILATILAFVCCGYAFYRYFHRIPPRFSPDVPGAIVAPADGTIWNITFLTSADSGSSLEISKKNFGRIQTLAADVENAGILVSIFMSPLDVHANWSPVSGKILQVKHTPGNFSFANTWKSLLNEKNEILMQGGGYKIKVIQIAGFLARRIECWVKAGDTVSRGGLIGMIRLGSQVSLILPRNAELKVKTGQKVRGGETILAMVGK